ncbi:MAG: hypothetical protein AAF235_11780, partial [Planctomycetota bacterium]
MPGHRTTRSTFPGRSAALLLAIFAGAASPAAAQNALGDGRLLDNNLATTTRFNAPVRDFQAEQRLRNAIVTGNAPGGLSFRADVGYGAVGDFSESLGSNDLFEFRRDSLTSGLGGLGIRGTNALQQQTALTTGSRPPSVLRAGTTVPRAGLAMQASMFREPRGGEAGGRPGVGPGQIISSTRLNAEGIVDEFDRSDSSLPGYGLDVQLRRDRDGSMFGTLRAPSAFLAAQDFTPAYLSPLETTRDGDPMSALVASSLRGVRAIDMTGTGAGLAGLEADARPGQRPSGIVDPGTVRNRVDITPGSAPGSPDTADGETPPNVGTAYQRVIRSIIEASEGTTDEARAEGAISPNQLRPAVEAMRKLLAEEDGRPTEGFEPGRVDSAQLVEAYTPLAEAVREAGDVDEFVDPDAPVRDIYAEHMLAGQRLMAESRYFAAEERFTLALTVRPSEVTARVGRVHAQIGAGMFMSASVNLTSLLREHPEISGARFAPQAFPTT